MLLKTHSDICHKLYSSRHIVGVFTLFALLAPSMLDNTSASVMDDGGSWQAHLLGNSAPVKLWAMRAQAHIANDVWFIKLHLSSGLFGSLGNWMVFDMSSSEPHMQVQ